MVGSSVLLFAKVFSVFVILAYLVSFVAYLRSGIAKGIAMPLRFRSDDRKNPSLWAEIIVRSFEQSDDNGNMASTMFAMRAIGGKDGYCAVMASFFIDLAMCGMAKARDDSVAFNLAKANRFQKEVLDILFRSDGTDALLVDMKDIVPRYRAAGKIRRDKIMSILSDAYMEYGEGLTVSEEELQFLRWWYSNRWSRERKEPDQIMLDMLRGGKPDLAYICSMCFDVPKKKNKRRPGVHMPQARDGAFKKDVQT